MEDVKKIASFTVDHDCIEEGIYISRIDGDVTTYDLRTRRPNMGDYMDKLTMHSVEHMIATFIRSSEIAQNVLYFGPMGCQTGFYLLVRGEDHERVRRVLLEVLERTVSFEGEMFGATRVECGNYKNLDLAAAKAECETYLAALKAAKGHFTYPEE